MKVIFFLLYSVHIITSLEHPCSGTGDYLYEVSSDESYCYHNFGDTQEVKDEYLYRCSNWFHLGTGASVHSDKDRDFLYGLAVSYGNPVWTGLIKVNNNNLCDPGGAIDFSWDDGTDVTYIITPGKVTKECSYSRDYCFFVRPSDGVWVDTSCDTRVPTCDGINATSHDDVCNGHGYCLDVDECACYTNYFGEYCESTHTCNSIRQDNITFTCSGHGYCTSQDNCVCLPNYFGEFCDQYSEGYCRGDGEVYHDGYCYKNFGSGLRFDSAEDHCQKNWVMSGGQQDLLPKHLVTLYSSSQTTFLKTTVMNEQMWIGLQKSDTSTIFSPCPPNGGYTWTDGVTSDDYAISKGSSISCDSDSFMCFMVDDDYFWKDVDCLFTNFETVCQTKLPTCKGLSSFNNSIICSGHGECVTTNNCSCFTNYYGQFCDFFECWDIQKNSDDVCSGHGTCNGPNWCICDENYIGHECNMTTCDGISSTDLSNVCNGHGRCTSFDHCDCDDDYGTYATFCNHTYPCQNVTSEAVVGGDKYVETSTSKFCGHLFHSILTYKASMDQCKEWFSGATVFHFQDWDEWLWFDYRSTFESPPGGEVWHGLQKVLNPNAYFCPDDANNASTVYWDDGYDSTYVNSNLGSWYWECNEVTRCFSWYSGGIYDCPCSQIHPAMCRAEIHECFGILEHNKSVCSGNGFCLGDNECTCKGKGFVYENCSVVNCYGVDSNQVNLVCSGHGRCMNNDDCLCQANWYGTYCNITSCAGIWTNETSENVTEIMCNGYGFCDGYNDCTCYDEFYFGDNCEHTYCNWIKSADTDEVCSGRGISCYPKDNCTCISKDYSGKFCEVTSCYGISSTNSSVCNGGGDCVSFNECECEEGFYSGEKCEIPKCNGIWSNDSQVCSGKGNCTSYQTCVCNSVDYFGDGDCDQTNCFGVFMGDKRVCSGHGDCWPLDTCNCHDDYFGQKCDITLCNDVMGNYSEGVCSGHGDCWPKDNCFCTSGNYYGPLCSIEWSGLWMGMFKYDDCGSSKEQQSMKLVRLKNGDCYPNNPKSIYVSHTDDTYFQNNFETKNCTLGTNTSSVEKQFGNCSIDATYYDYYIKQEDFSMLRDEFTVSRADSFLVMVFFDDYSESQETCESFNEPILEVIQIEECINKFSKNFVVHLDPTNDCEITISTFGDSDTSCLSIAGSDNIHYHSGDCVPDPFGGNDYYVSMGWIYKDELCLTGVLNSTSTCDVCSTQCFGRYRYSGDPLICSEHGNCVDTDVCDCDDDYYGGDGSHDCNITLCDGRLSNDSNVCNGHGNCWPFDVCTCDVNYNGTFCDICNEYNGYYGSECTEYFNSSLEVELDSNSSRLFIPYQVPVDITIIYDDPNRRSGDDIYEMKEFECGKRIKNWREYLGGDENWPEATCFWKIDFHQKSVRYHKNVTKGIIYQINHDSHIYRPVPDGQRRVHRFEIHLCTEERNITLEFIREGNIIAPTPPPPDDDDDRNIGGAIAGAVAGGLAAGLLAMIIIAAICGGLIISCCLCLLLFVLMFITIVFGCGVLVFVLCTGTTAATTGAAAGVVGKEVHDEVMDEGPDFVKEAVKQRWTTAKQQQDGGLDIEMEGLDFEDGEEKSEKYITDNLQDDILRQDEEFEDPEGLNVGMNETGGGIAVDGDDDGGDGFAGIGLEDDDDLLLGLTEEEKEVSRRREEEYLRVLEQRKEEERLKREEERLKREERERIKFDRTHGGVQEKINEIRKKEEEDGLNLRLSGTKFGRKKNKEVEKKLMKLEKGLVKEHQKEVRKIEKMEGKTLSLRAFEKKKRKEEKIRERGLALGGNVV